MCISETDSCSQGKNAKYNSCIFHQDVLKAMLVCGVERRGVLRGCVYVMSEIIPRVASNNSTSTCTAFQMMASFIETYTTDSLSVISTALNISLFIIPFHCYSNNEYAQLWIRVSATVLNSPTGWLSYRKARSRAVLSGVLRDNSSLIYHIWSKLQKSSGLPTTLYYPIDKQPQNVNFWIATPQKWNCKINIMLVIRCVIITDVDSREPRKQLAN